jgi:L-malate glycosyltransferase
LIKVVRKVKPTIIHGAVFEGVISAAFAGTLLRIPIVILEETSDPQNRSWRGHILLRFLSLFGDRVVAISPSVNDYLKETAKIPHDKLTLINNGVDPPTPADPEKVRITRQHLGLKETDFVIGSVGRLRDFHKRFSDLIKALAVLRKESLDFKLLILGNGQDKQALADLATELGVRDDVIFAGFQQDTTLYYSCMDVFSLASHMEGFGLVVVEAMFFHLPVVVTAVGGMKDIVIDKETGFLVEKHSPELLAKALLQLYADPALQKQMGERGYERAMKEYSAQAYSQKVEALYDGILKSKKLI